MMDSVIGRMVPFFCMMAGSCLAATAAAAASADETRTVRGTVRSEALRFPVCWSPTAGRSCERMPGAVRTALEDRSGRFVFVTTPAGYWTEEFYVPRTLATTTGRGRFALHRVEQPERFDFVFITDMHLENQQVGIAKIRASLREINALQPQPAFLWAQGDICLQGARGPGLCGRA